MTHQAKRYSTSKFMCALGTITSRQKRLARFSMMIPLAPANKVRPMELNWRLSPPRWLCHCSRSSLFHLLLILREVVQIQNNKVPKNHHTSPAPALLSPWCTCFCYSCSIRQSTWQSPPYQYHYWIHGLYSEAHYAVCWRCWACHCAQEQYCQSYWCTDGFTKHFHCQPNNDNQQQYKTII